MTFAEAPIEQRAPLPYLPDVRAGPYGERRPPAPAQRSGPLTAAADGGAARFLRPRPAPGTGRSSMRQPAQARGTWRGRGGAAAGARTPQRAREGRKSCRPRCLPGPQSAGRRRAILVRVRISARGGRQCARTVGAGARVADGLGEGKGEGALTRLGAVQIASPFCPRFHSSSSPNL